MLPTELPYRYYDEVPFYRHQWFFWLTYFICWPVAFGILIFGDVYYQKDGKLRSFGPANRIVAASIPLVATYAFLSV
jgi:hypothetical protein